MASSTEVTISDEASAPSTLPIEDGDMKDNLPVNRPTLLFSSNETLGLSIANKISTSTPSPSPSPSSSDTFIVKPQLAQSPSSNATTTSVSSRMTSANSPNSPNSNVTSPSFLPDMPQWKKDLIQRRKTNVARTLGASNSGCGLTPTSSNSSLASPTTSAATSPLASLNASASLMNAGHHYANSTLDSLHSPVKESNSTFRSSKKSLSSSASSPDTKVIKQYTKTTASQEQQQSPKKLQAEDLAVTGSISELNHKATTSTTTTATTKLESCSPAEEHLVEEETFNAKMSVTNSPTSCSLNSALLLSNNKPICLPLKSATTSFSPTKLLKSPTITLPSKEKSSNKLNIGGHYTSSITNDENNFIPNDHHNNDVDSDYDIGKQDEKMDFISADGSLQTAEHLSSQTITRCLTKSSFGGVGERGGGGDERDEILKPIPKQRSFVSLPTGKTTINTLSSSSSFSSLSSTTTSSSSIIKSATAKSLDFAAEEEEEPQNKYQQQQQRQLEVLSESETKYSTSANTKATCLTGFPEQQSQQQEQQQQQQYPKQQEQQQQKSQTSNYAIESNKQKQRIYSTITSLQTNSFTSSQLHSKNYNERSSSSVTTNNQQQQQQLVNVAAVPQKISLKLQNNTFIKNQQQQNISNNSSSPKYSKYKSNIHEDINKISSVNNYSASSYNKVFNSNINKMVAVQDMKKTTATADSSNMNNGSNKFSSNSSNLNNESGFGEVPNDEDLSFGPGIVSKLRCRYMSLALRESMENRQNMRRATSLSNLLERDDEHEDEEDDEDIDEENANMEENERINILEISENNFKNKQEENEVLKVRATILKNSSSTDYKKTANANSTTPIKASNLITKNKNSANLNGAGGVDSLSATSGNETPSLIEISPIKSSYISASNGESGSRSRLVKRGNDSLKRARSVEALLCERSPWHFVGNRSSYNPRIPSTSTPTCVTIEDKIQSARGRMLTGSESHPPKRLTSIIDDAERPPPDLVKQTLKMFEANSNRRRNYPQRGNFKGDVATKVANYRNIIRENKPAMNYHKGTPSSPTKKMQLTTLKPVAKPIVAAADLINSPIGRKTINAANAAASANNFDDNESSSLAKQQQPRHNSPNNNLSGILSNDTPDIIPRHALLEMTEKASTPDSPLSALSKKLGTLRLETNNSSPATLTTKELPSSCQNQNRIQQQSLPIKYNTTTTSATTTTKNSSAVAIHTHDGSANKQRSIVGGDVSINEVKYQQQQHQANLATNITADRTAPATNIEPFNQHENQQQQVKTKLLNESMQQHRQFQYEQQQSHENQQANFLSSSSDLSDEDDENQDSGDGSVDLKKTKRITRTALDNIAKAGTTQQFKFAGSNNNNANLEKSAQKNYINSNSTSGISSSSVSNNRIDSNGTHSSPSASSSDIPSSLLNASPRKQIGVIRPLISNSNSNSSLQQHLQSQRQKQEEEEGKEENKSYIKHQEEEDILQTNNYLPPLAPLAAVTSTPTPPALTPREIEKNRINEMKKSNAFIAANNLISDSSSVPSAPFATATTSSGSSPNTVINSNSMSSTASPSMLAAGFSELDTSGSSPTTQMTVGSTNSPLWALRKKRQTPPSAVAENTTMVFNFSNRKEVPDYIENDGVIIRRKRELPKPNESGFVLLGDLSVETSTDNDSDDFSMCPPSPCDVEFENANVVIDGKSSIRQKAKESTFHVQFNDTLTTTFEYPSESSLIIDNTTHEYMNPVDDLDAAFQNMILKDSPEHAKDHQRVHHHVADEIIELPTTTTVTNTSNSPTKNILGNLSLGSAPLGLYTPVKAPIESLFQLGVTRAPETNGYSSTVTTQMSATSTPTQATAATNGNNNVYHNTNGTSCGGSILGIKDGLNGDCSIATNFDEEPESLQYIKPGNDDLNIVYSEGTQKTDLLY